MSDSKRYAVAIHDGRGWHTVLTTSSVAVADHSAHLLLQWTMYCDDTRVIDRQPERKA